MAAVAVLSPTAPVVHRAARRRADRVGLAHPPRTPAMALPAFLAPGRPPPPRPNRGSNRCRTRCPPSPCASLPMGNAGDPPPPSPSGAPSPPTPAASVGASSTPAAGSATPTTSDTSPHAPPPSTRSPNKGAGRPPRSYTGAVPPPASFTLTPIAHVRSPYTERFGTPRQPPVTEGTLHGTAQRGAIVLDPAAFPGGPSQMAAALAGLDGFSHVWVVTVLHLNGDGWRASVKPPRGDRARRVGVFATRSPHRPNRLGLSALRIVGVAPDAGVVDVQGLDLLDGTPVLDLKPYVAYTDGVGVGGRGGWVEEVADAVEPDYLSYSPRPPHLEAPPPALRPSPPSSTGSV